LQSSRPATRVQALSALDGIGALLPSHVRAALRDPHASVRRHAIRVSEAFLRRADSDSDSDSDSAPLDPAVAAALLERVDDPDAHVRMQLAYSLGEWRDPRAGRALGRLAVRDAGDRWITAAALSSVTPHLGAFLEVVLAASARPDVDRGAVRALVEKTLPLAAQLDRSDALRGVLDALTRRNGAGGFDAWQLGSLTGLLDALRPEHARMKAELAAAADRVGAVFDAARELCTRSDVSASMRLAAVRLLGRADRGRVNAADATVLADLEALAARLDPTVPRDEQVAVIDALGRSGRRHAAGLLLDGWKSHSPSLRGRILDVLASRASWWLALFDAIERDDVARSDIDATRRQLCLEHRDRIVRERAAKVFGAIVSDRAAVVERFAAVKSIQGSAERGRVVFEKRCAQCHRLGGVGYEVGPDLAALVDRSADAILIAVLDPNRAIEGKYAQYTAVTRDGRVTNGILVDETGASVTLLGQEGKRDVIVRRDLLRLENAGISLMPEGLEQDMSPEETADLIASLQEAWPQPKAFDGNAPRVVGPTRDGSLLLTAENCEIHGSTLRFETRYRNLGYWGSADDRAVWRVDAPAAGRYRVELEWACDADTAGNRAVVVAPSSRLEFRVEGTGTWDNYRRKAVGEIELRAGRQRVVFGAAGAIRQYLVDLRAIRLRAR